MKMLARLIALILSSLVFSTALTFILNRTVLHADYMIPRAKEAKVFDAGAELLPTLAVPQDKRNSKEGRELHAKLGELFTPAYLEAKLTPFVQQLEEHYRHNGPAPTIDLKAIAADAKTAGLDIDTDSITAPLKIPDNTDLKVQSTIDVVRKSQTVTLVIALVLAVALALISIKKHDYSGIINVFVINALLFVIMWGILRFAPNFAIQFIPTGMADLKPLIDTFTTMVIRVTRDIGWQCALVAIVLAGAAIAVYAIATISRLRHKTPAKA